MIRHYQFLIYVSSSLKILIYHASLILSHLIRSILYGKFLKNELIFDHQFTLKFQQLHR